MSFLGKQSSATPYIIGVAGSVAVGKSTFARLLQAVLSKWTDHPRVEIVATDGFLYPSNILIEKNLMRRKGFPESYDVRSLISFLAAVKAGQKNTRVPCYSHHSYDIIPGQWQNIESPDVIIFEGLNVLQPVPHAEMVASDYFDLSIYIDAAVEHLATWYSERFKVLQRSSFQDPTSYFYKYHSLRPEDVTEEAKNIWENINLPNLKENILPTRERARLVLRKGPRHTVEEIWFRR